MESTGPVRDLNRGPPATKAGIIHVDQQADGMNMSTRGVLKKVKKKKKLGLTGGTVNKMRFH